MLPRIVIHIRYSDTRSQIVTSYRSIPGTFGASPLRGRVATYGFLVSSCLIKRRGLRPLGFASPATRAIVAASCSCRLRLQCHLQRIQGQFLCVTFVPARSGLVRFTFMDGDGPFSWYIFLASISVYISGQHL